MRFSSEQEIKDRLKGLANVPDFDSWNQKNKTFEKKRTLSTADHDIELEFLKFVKLKRAMFGTEEWDQLLSNNALRLKYYHVFLDRCEGRARKQALIVVNEQRVLAAERVMRELNPLALETMTGRASFNGEEPVTHYYTTFNLSRSEYDFLLTQGNLSIFDLETYDVDEAFRSMGLLRIEPEDDIDVPESKI